MQARHTEIVEPSPGNFFELLNALIETHRRGLPGDDFQLLFQVFPAFVACNQLGFPFLSLLIRGYLNKILRTELPLEESQRLVDSIFVDNSQEDDSAQRPGDDLVFNHSFR